MSVLLYCYINQYSLIRIVTLNLYPHNMTKIIHIVEDCLKLVLVIGLVNQCSNKYFH